LWDTPGVHRGRHRLNRNMVEEALASLEAADVVCLIVDASAPHGGGDRFLLDLLARAGAPKLVALNKADRMKKSDLLPRIEIYADAGGFDEIVPISALDGDGVELLADLLWERLPVGEPLYDPDLFTLQPERFLAAELIRERVLAYTREELPFSTAVVIDSWEEDPASGLVRIEASILVERDGQRRILIGSEGAMIKQISTEARLEIEALLGRRVFLRAQVRTQAQWRENRRVLARLEAEVRGDT
ncbi:MAG: GTPase Era, partial [Thermoanaerobaculia bacterium]|nr:GTPase Era [Thermoanaerobaculia bacterium]